MFCYYKEQNIYAMAFTLQPGQKQLILDFSQQM